MSTCRICGGWSESGPDGHVIKYSTRHYAHARCGLVKWGTSFFDRLHDWQIRNFPALIAQQCGVYDELARRIDAMPAEKEFIL